MPETGAAWGTLDGPDLDDPLDTNAWAHRALAASMAEVVDELRTLQDELTAARAHQFGGEDEIDRIERKRLARRAELREIAGSMRALIPQARLRDAEDAVRGEDRAMSKADGTGPVADAAYLDRSDCRPKAKRGRPRKRSLL